jgi:Dipeptidyl peptidase IV (DPP IV) N-terminal region
MPEVQTLFQMVIKTASPDRGFVDRQHRRQKRRARNRKIGTIGLVAVVVAALITITLASAPGHRQRPAGSPTRSSIVPPVNAMTGPSFFVDLATEEASPLPGSIEDAGYQYPVSPDGSMFAFDPCCAGVRREAYVANIDGTGVRPISPDDMFAIAPRWAPVGTTVVYQGTNQQVGTGSVGNLFVTDVRTGIAVQVTRLDQSHTWSWWFLSPGFTADGKAIVFHLPRLSDHGEAWDLWTVPVTGGTKTLLRRNAAYGAYAPDGSLAYLAPFHGGSAGGNLWIVDGPTGTPRELVHGPRIEWPRWSPDGTRIVYVKSDHVYVVDVATGDSRRVAEGGVAEWFDDQTLVVGEGGCPGC